MLRMLAVKIVLLCTLAIVKEWFTYLWVILTGCLCKPFFSFSMWKDRSQPVLGGEVKTCTTYAASGGEGAEDLACKYSKSCSEMTPLVLVGCEAVAFFKLSFWMAEWIVSLFFFAENIIFHNTMPSQIFQWLNVCNRPWLWNMLTGRSCSSLFVMPVSLSF